MPEFIHTFQRGRMNKDLDERLIPNGEYRDALNLDIANSDGSNVGTLQNVKGNVELRNKTNNTLWQGDYIDALDNPVCIGSIRHDKEEKIYWFIASDNASAIAEYDQTTNIISPILVDYNNILNFSSSYLITGVNILDKFLFWTDDQTEPKKINIEKFKKGSCDFSTHTKIPEWVPAIDDYVQIPCPPAVTTQPDFTEEDITVIKKSPLTSPTLDLAASKYGAGIDGTGINPVVIIADEPIPSATSGAVNFTYIPQPVQYPSAYDSLPTYGEYLANTEGDPTYYDTSSIGPGWDGKVVISLTTVPIIWQQQFESNQPTVILLNGTYENDWNETFEYQVRLLIDDIDGGDITCEIQAISSDIARFENSDGDIELITWEAVIEEEAAMFEYVFPRFAYRWKYIDNEYSAFSPFSSVAFVGDEFKYLSSDGYNIGMVNNVRKLEVKNLTWGSEEVSEIEILYKESNNTSVYSVETLKRKDYSPYNTAGGVLPTQFQIETELIGATIEPNQILRPWDNVPRKAKSQEVVANRIIYGNYLQNYNVDNIDLSLTLNRSAHPSQLEGDQVRMPFPSLKSIRTYQAGIVYKDEFGRETPVFSSKNSSLKIDIKDSDAVTKLAIASNSTPPSWATHYKFFIKETSNEYYNLALDRFYFAEDGNIWLSFPSSERNKVDEQTYLILKKQHDNDIAVDSLNRYKILAIESSPPDFISTFETIIWFGNVQIEPNSAIGPNVITLRFTTSTNVENLNSSLSNDAKIKIVKGGNQTEVYDIASGGPEGNNNYVVTLEEPFGQDASFLNPGDDVTLQVLKDENKNLPQFEGRFFAKINRDFAFDTNIIASFAQLEPRYAIKDETIISTGDTTRYGFLDYGIGGDQQLGFWYGDRGWFEGNDPRTDEWRIYGIGSWSPVAGSVPDIGGEPNGTQSRIQTHMLDNGYQPPTQNQNTFGISRIGAEVSQWFSPNFGRTNYAGSIGGGTAADNPVAPNGYFQAGSYIRFRATKSAPATDGYEAVEAGDLTRPYLITFAAANTFERGNTGDEGGTNYRYSIVMHLDLPIAENWMPRQGDWERLKDVLPAIQTVEEFLDNNNSTLTSSNPAIFETEPKEAVDLDLYYEASDAYAITDHTVPVPAEVLDWHNCYSYGNGVESNRIRDDYNAVYIDKGPKVSTVLDEPYAEERRGSGLIFSQLYNSTSGINRLNQFIQALPITKDLNPIYGTIQKLHARDTDAIVLCEDKCLKILANKDALYNADGNVNLTGNNAVLGQAIPYAGEYGISKNPESFASYAFRAYFSDKNRGAVIRLSADGITNIAEKGMSDFFADNLRSSTKILGSYDDDKDIYNITLDNLSQQWVNEFSSSQDYQLSPDCNVDQSGRAQTTVSFKESVDGWTSRKSFIPESGVSLNNIYYTFKEGRIYEHSLNTLANNFYRVQYDSSFNVFINEQPQIVKGFSAINYTGTQSRRFEYLYNAKWYSIAEINFNTTIPIAVQQKQPGWYVNYVKTDLEGGEVKEFEKKEGKWFNYIKALEIFNDCEEIPDGIGNPDIIESEPQDYILTVTIDEDCSGSGSSIPDTIQFFVNIWGNIKNDPTLELNIVNETTAQDVKCAIDGLYDLLYQSYGGVTNDGTAFSYVSGDGLQVGTQMYNSLTNEPIAVAGAYLFVGAGEQMSDLTVNHAGLDNNNPTSVPSTYYVMILDSSGQITSWTQYNTLSACAP